MFENKIVVITGGANGIGKTITEEFRKNGAIVCIIDIAENDYYVGDISNKEVLENFVQKVSFENGTITGNVKLYRSVR